MGYKIFLWRIDRNFLRSICSIQYALYLLNFYVMNACCINVSTIYFLVNLTKEKKWLILSLFCVSFGNLFKD